MAACEEKYDSALLGILQNEGQVAPFLDAIIGFLYRRTDYFRIMKTDSDKLGFPPGVALKLLVNIFKKYESMSAKNEEMRSVQAPAKTTNSQVASVEKANPAAQNSIAAPQTEARAETQESADERGTDISTQPSTTRSDSTKDDSKPNQGMEMEKVEAASKENPEKNAQENEEEEKEDPEQARLRRELQANPLTYNGADCDTYLWSQSIAEVDIRVKVPKSIVKGKQVKVDIKKKRISVSCQQGASFSELASGELEWEVKAEDSMWTLCPGEFVHINLEKKQERWWERVFIGESGINTRKIDCSRPMTDLDDEAQAKIEEMMFNQRQKQLGLPQSHEVKTHEMLRKAWDAEGSPFKGQPFDPSKFTVDPSGTATFNPGDS
ncbi:hypothetical protein EGW08_002424 [Elysia chlorotica]|uniref:CS domain-containing protein n=1 Tax=Elysia chlorotica TaxID=188477 RepID=A0A433U7N3_ELYCH|nr:hypothetical protein EGW08_002424 [Elysia chlorotica]